jgi:hypothetical protein
MAMLKPTSVRHRNSRGAHAFKQRRLNYKQQPESRHLRPND